MMRPTINEESDCLRKKNLHRRYRFRGYVWTVENATNSDTSGPKALTDIEEGRADHYTRTRVDGT
jgi:hypothetical protein